MKIRMRKGMPMVRMMIDLPNFESAFNLGTWTFLLTFLPTLLFADLGQYPTNHILDFYYLLT